MIPSEINQIKIISTSQLMTCVIDIEDTLKCWLNLKSSNKFINRPSGFQKNTKTVDVGINQICAISLDNISKCYQIHTKKKNQMNLQFNIDYKNKNTFKNKYNIDTQFKNLILKSNKFSLIEQEMPVVSPNYFTNILTGRYHTCGTLQTGELICWSYDEDAYIKNNQLIQNKKLVNDTQ